MNWKKHFYHDVALLICTTLYSLQGKNSRCRFLVTHDEGWYSCRVFGFRYKQSSVKGLVRRKGVQTFYDFDMLYNAKNRQRNYCGYRLLGPVVLFIVTVPVLKGVIDLVKTIYGLVRT